MITVLTMQFTAAAVFIVNFLIRWGDRTVAEAEPVWIVLDVIGVGIVLTGACFGGVMVYQLGMRVHTAEEAPRRTPTRMSRPRGMRIWGMR
jgi:uncharacterized membrane protein